MTVTDDYQYQFGSLDFGDSTDFDVVAHSGFGMPPVRSNDLEVARAHGLQAGNDFVDGRFVELTLEVDGTAATDLNTNIASLAAAFQPGAGEAPLIFQLPGYAAGGRRCINCRVRRMEHPGTLEQMRGLATVELQLFATDPRIYDDTEQSLNTTLPAGSDGLTFPLTFPLVFGATTSGSITCNNAGNFATGALLRIDGPVTNPKAENVTTGERIELDLVVATGDYIEIDTAAHTVLLNGTASRYSSLTTTSTWWDLAPGNNEIRFQAATSGTALLAVTWRSAWTA